MEAEPEGLTSSSPVRSPLPSPHGAPRRPGGAQVIPAPSRREPGHPPPWTGRDADLSLNGVLARLSGRISDVGVTSSPRSDERISAVMGLLVDGPLGAEILLTRRSSKLNNHRGEMSFPGGRADEGESIVDAAMRETFEEVGIESSLISVQCELSPLSTFVSRSYIVPVIASIAAKPELHLNEHEVERALWVPLAELVRPDTYVSEMWTFSLSTASSDGDDDRGHGQPMHFFYLDDETVWGATARMLHELLTLTFG